MITVVLLTASFILSVILTGAIKRAAVKLNFMDRPKNELKNHAHPVPYAGFSIWFCFMIIILGARFFTSYETGTLYQLRGIVIGGSGIMLLGLFDDIYNLNFKTKFFWQIAAAFILVYYGIYVKIFPLNLINIALSVFWVVLVVNAVNIIDVMDGLSVGISAISALGFFAVALPTEKLYVNFAALILFGTLSGFWFYNKPKAKVFMGDTGSLFVGFILASLSMGANYSNINTLGLFSPFLLLGLPIYDTVLVSYFRWRRGQPIFKGSKDHYALRMGMLGFSEWKIDAVSYAIAAMLSISAFFITIVPAGYAMAILLLIILFALIGSSILDTADPYKDKPEI